MMKLMLLEDQPKDREAVERIVDSLSEVERTGPPAPIARSKHKA
ncbi:hypothetical protein [Paenibacillus campinasensis]|nr:hypothetical protein [Paenibacillus campinasensis]